MKLKPTGTESELQPTSGTVTSTCGNLSSPRSRYPLSGEQGVVALIALAALHEALAGDDQLLSHAFDRWLDKYPVLTTTVTVTVAATTVLHLLNRLPPAIDPYHRIGNYINRKKTQYVV